ncbi:MAG TPA: hypothetical protein VHA14_11240 [Bryobacteraceae bacterium]|nr:hypothetical protein [Bryobacteraceae bacterium]
MKSYFDASVQVAMEQARRELGTEAILVTSRVAPPQAGKPGEYEVVFATDLPEMPAAPSVERRRASETPAARVASSAEPIGEVLTEIREIRRNIQTWLPRTDPAIRITDDSSREIFAQLTKADVDPDLAQELLLASTDSVRGSGAVAGETAGRFADFLRIAQANVTPTFTNLRAAVAGRIRESFRIDTGFPANNETAIAALIGPAGCGKTSAIVKLAVRHGLAARRSTLVISAGNYRVGARESLRAYAAVLGVRYETAAAPAALERLIDENRGYGLILIDTPGVSSCEFGKAAEIAAFLADQSDIRRHLVLPAPMRCAEMSRTATAFGVFRPSHLIFSRMDETTLLGPVLSETISSGLPVSFFSTGPETPEDISEANADFILDRLLPAPAATRAAAAAA